MLALGVALALIGAAGFAGMNTSVRHGVRADDPDDGLFTTVLVNVGAFTILVAALALARRQGPVDPLGVVVFIAAGFCATFLGRGLLFAGIARIGAARATAVKNATPLVTVTIALVFLGERLTPGAALGVVIVLAGVFLLVRETLRLARRQGQEAEVDGDPTAASRTLEGDEALAVEDSVFEPLEQATPGIGRAAALRGSAARWRSGRDMALVVGISFALLSTLAFGSGHALRKVGIEIMPDALLAATIGSWTAFVAYLVAAAFRGRVRDGFGTALARPRRSFWIAGLLSCVGQLAMFAALDIAPVSVVSVVGASEAILTVLFAAVVLGRAELITRRVVVPAALVFIGSAVIALAG